MADNASEFVGSIPENYDKGLGPNIFEPYAADLAERIRQIGPEKVLELAAGTGIVSRQISDALPDSSELVVTDLNEPMLEVAKAKFDQAADVSFEAVDACDLPYSDYRFDLIACQFGVMFFPDKTRHFSEALRVLKPGGTYVFNCWGPWSENQFAEIAHHSVAKHFPEDPPAFYKVPFAYCDKEEIGLAMESAGFEKIRIERVRFSRTISSMAHFSQGLIFGNPISAEITDRGGDCETVRQELEAALTMTLGDSQNLMALVVSGIRPQS